MLSFTHPLMLFQTCMTFFLLWNIIEDILKNVFVHTNQWTDTKGLVASALQNIFYVPQENESHTCVERHE